MDRSLVDLLRLRLRGGIRQRMRQLSGPRGLFSFAVLAAVVWIVLSSDWQSGNTGVGHADLQQLRENLADFLPFALLGATALTVILSAGSPIHFSAQEINFLLAGPYSRRGVLAYKFAVYIFGALVNAAIITLLLPPRGGPALAGFAGAALSLLFIQASSTSLILSVNAIRHRFVGAWWRHVVALVIVFCASATLWVVSLAAESTLPEILTQIRHHWLGELLLAPFVVFVEIFLAPELGPGFAFWLLTGTGINALLIYAVFILDRYSGEPSPYRRSLFRPRRGPIRHSLPQNGSRQWTRVPLAVTGLGPIIWRQLINAQRGYGRVILSWLVIAIISAPLIAVTASLDKIGMQLGIGFFAATYMLPKTLHLDFRNDLGAMEIYKALPLKAWQIFAGQIVVVASVASLIELTAISGLFLAADDISAWWLGAAALSVLIFNLVFFALENLAFLLFPSPPVPVGRVDFEFMGRTIAEYFVKASIMIAAVAAALAVGFGLAPTFGGNLALPLVFAWLTLFGFALLLTGLGALAFRRFVVSEAID